MRHPVRDGLAPNCSMSASDEISQTMNSSSAQALNRIPPDENRTGWCANRIFICILRCSDHLPTTTMRARRLGGLATGARRPDQTPSAPAQYAVGAANSLLPDSARSGSREAAGAEEPSISSLASDGCAAKAFGNVPTLGRRRKFQDSNSDFIRQNGQLEKRRRTCPMRRLKGDAPAVSAGDCESVRIAIGL